MGQNLESHSHGQKKHMVESHKNTLALSKRERQMESNLLAIDKSGLTM